MWNSRNHHVVVFWNYSTPSGTLPAPHNAQGNGPVSMVITQAPEEISAGSHFSPFVSSLQSIFLSSLQSGQCVCVCVRLNNHGVLLHIYAFGMNSNFLSVPVSHPESERSQVEWKWAVILNTGFLKPANREMANQNLSLLISRSPWRRLTSLTQKQYRRSHRWAHGFASRGRHELRRCWDKMKLYLSPRGSVVVIAE